MLLFAISHRWKIALLASRFACFYLKWLDASTEKHQTARKNMKKPWFSAWVGSPCFEKLQLCFLEAAIRTAWADNTSASHITSTSWLPRSPAMSAKVSSAAKMTKTCASFKFQVAKGYLKTTIDLRSVNINCILCMGVQRIDEKKWLSSYQSEMHNHGLIVFYFKTQILDKSLFLHICIPYPSIL